MWFCNRSTRRAASGAQAAADLAVLGAQLAGISPEPVELAGVSKPGSAPALLKLARGEPSPEAPAAGSSACPGCSLPFQYLLPGNESGHAIL